MDLSNVYQDLETVVEELLSAAEVKPGQVFVVGCSTSEVLGEKIGSVGSLEVAENVFSVLEKAAKKHNVYLAIQCCEHLNRALVVEREAQEKFGWTEVCVVPWEHAGGSLGTLAYKRMREPVMVEEVVANVGLDIGQTLIGMHLKRVAVPVRLSKKTIGGANITAAKTRPPLIGGERARYK